MNYFLIYIIVGIVWWLLHIRTYVAGFEEMYLALDEQGKTHFGYKAVFTVVAVFLTLLFYPAHVGQTVYEKITK